MTPAAFITILVAIALGVFLHKKRAAKEQMEQLQGERYDKLLAIVGDKEGRRDSPIDIVNRCVTMTRARAIRVVDDSLTVIYARENKTKGRVKFDMDGAFDDVCEGDVGILVIIDTEISGRQPFYKFIRDADIPTIDDVIKVGTGDELTDAIFKSAMDKGIKPLKEVRHG